MSETEVKGTATLIPESTEGKTFSEDYVKTIREEAKENRIARKAAESDLEAVKLKFKTFLGLKPEDELKDDYITAYKIDQESKLAATLQKANERLLQAEIKSLDGYDSKLVSRLLDRTKVKIADDGTVTGLKEAIAALEAEFPQVKIGTERSGANPPQTNLTIKDEYEAALKQAYLNPHDESLKRKVFLLKEKLKGE